MCGINYAEHRYIAERDRERQSGVFGWKYKKHICVILAGGASSQTIFFSGATLTQEKKSENIIFRSLASSLQYRRESFGRRSRFQYPKVCEVVSSSRELSYVVAKRGFLVWKMKHGRNSRLNWM